jgi:hypothetical protein
LRHHFSAQIAGVLGKSIPMSARPAISVAIPLYNKEAYIEATVRSALGQSFADFEILVVDDGSRDQSLDRLSHINDPRLMVIRQKNAGVGAARNRALADATAPFVAFLDADDLWNPEHLAHLMILHQRFPQAELLGNRFMEMAGDMPSQLTTSVEYRLLDEYFEICALQSQPFFTSSCMVRRERALAVGGFPTGKVCGEDLALWIKLAVQAPVAASTHVGAIYRRPAVSLSSSSSYRTAPDSSMATIQDLLGQHPEWSVRRRRQLEEYFFRLALAHVLDSTRAGEAAEAAKYLRLSSQTQELRWRWRQAKLLSTLPKPLRQIAFAFADRRRQTAARS